MVLKRCHFIVLIGVVIIVVAAFAGFYWWWNNDEEILRRRADRGDASAMIRLSETARAKGKNQLATRWLGEAAKAGSETAVSRLEEEAETNSEAALEALYDYYVFVGKGKQSMELYYRLAQLSPASHALTVGIFYLFGEEELKNEARGRECLVLAAEHGKPAVYLLLMDLANGGIVMPPPKGVLLQWRSEAEKLKEVDLRLLAGLLSTFEMTPLKEYQEKWKVRAYGTAISPEQPIKIRSPAWPNFPRDLLAQRWISKDATYTVNSVYEGHPPLPLLLTGIGELYEGEYAFRTKKQANPHIIITLRQSAMVNGILIVNRYYRARGRAEGLTVWVSVDGQQWKRIWTALSIQPSWWIELTPVRAKYVKVGLRRTDWLHLAGVRIYRK